MSLRFTVKVPAITRSALEYCKVIAMIFKKMLGCAANFLALLNLVKGKSRP